MAGYERLTYGLLDPEPSASGDYLGNTVDALNNIITAGGGTPPDPSGCWERDLYNSVLYIENNPGVEGVFPLITNVLSGIIYGPNSNLTGTLTIPATSNVLSGVVYGVGGTGSTGTFNPWVFGNITVVSNLANPDPAGSYSYHGIVNGYISFRYVSALTWQIYYVGNVVHLAPLVGGVPDATNYYVIGSQPTGSLISSLSTAHGNLTGVVLTRNYLLSS
jgi:hypothetical protein